MMSRLKAVLEAKQAELLRRVPRCDRRKLEAPAKFEVQQSEFKDKYNDVMGRR